MTDKFDPFIDENKIEDVDAVTSLKRPKKFLMVLTSVFTVVIVLIFIIFSIPTSKDYSDEIYNKAETENLESLKNKNQIIFDLHFVSYVRAYSQEIYINALVGFKLKPEYEDWIFKYYDKLSDFKLWEFKKPLEKIFHELCLKYSSVNHLKESAEILEGNIVRKINDDEKLILCSINTATSEVISILATDFDESIVDARRDQIKIKVGENFKTAYIVDENNSVIKDVYFFDNIFLDYNIEITSISTEIPYNKGNE